MYSTSLRTQTFGTLSFNFTVSLLFILGLLYHLRDPQKPFTNFKVSLNNNNVQVSPNVDLTDQFKPGLKQIFLYVKMISERGEEMVWSLIIKRTDNKKISRNYYMTYRTKEKCVGSKFELWGNYFPYVGIITYKKLGEYVL